MPPQSLVRFLRAPASPAESDVRQHAGSIHTLQKRHVNTRSLTSIPRRQQSSPDTDLLRTHVIRFCHTNAILDHSTFGRSRPTHLAMALSYPMFADSPPPTAVLFMCVYVLKSHTHTLWDTAQSLPENAVTVTVHTTQMYTWLQHCQS